MPPQQEPAQVQPVQPASGPVEPSPQAPILSPSHKKLFFIGGGVLSAALLVAAVNMFVIGGNGPKPGPIEEISPNASALFVQSHRQQGDQKKVSVIAIDSQTGEQKIITEIQNSEKHASLVPIVRVSNSRLYYLGADNSIVQYDIESGQTTTTPVKGYIPAGQNTPWGINSFQVRGNTLAYLAMGPTDESPNEYGSVVPSKPCVIRTANLTTGVEDTVLSIQMCEAAHGPYYSIHDISLDGTKLYVSEEYSESGYASVNLNTVDAIAKTSTTTETFVLSPVCSEGMFYEADKCTQEVKDENAKFNAFENARSLGYGVPSECGSMTVKKDEDEYYTLHITVAGKTITLEDAGYAACLAN